MSLKSLFIQETPESIKQESPEPTPAPTRTAYHAPAPSASVDPELSRTLTSALESNALDGYDYLKFRGAVQELASDIPDQKLRFKTVFATAKSLGITKDKLIKTAQHYLTVLDEEERKFNEAHGEQIDSADALRKQAEEKNAQVSALNAQLASLQREIENLNSTVASTESALSDQVQAFKVTRDSMVAEIKNDIGKMSTYLG